MTAYVLSADKSRVRIRTFAEGLLARLAHDLELRCGDLEGTATRDGEGGSAKIEAPIAAISVAGVLHGERVDERGLSPSDQRDVLEKMKRDVFHASGGGEVVVEATLDAGRARVKVIPPNGRAFDATTRVELVDDAGAVRARGSLSLSLSAIGSDAVKGPMGAFRMKDKVEIHFDLVFQPA